MKFPHNFGEKEVLLDLSCAIGVNPTTPMKAPNQPDTYPPQSVYRFPLEYRGLDAKSRLIDDLEKNLFHFRNFIQSGGDKQRKNGRTVVNLACHKSKLANGSNKEFEAGCMRQEGVKRESVKK